MEPCFYFAIPSAILLAVLQSTVTAQWRLFGASPDLVLLLVVSWASLRGIREGVLVAMTGGIILDALSGAPFGLGILALTITGALSGLGERNVFRTASYLPFLAIALATLVYNGTLTLFLRLSGESRLVGLTLGRIILPATIINLLCMPVVFLICRLVARSRAAEPVEWQ